MMNTITRRTERYSLDEMPGYFILSLAALRYKNGLPVAPYVGCDTLLLFFLKISWLTPKLPLFCLASGWLRLARE
jgi:membrane protein YqaA with SNARE-associated domain